jgi:hypothetical protein
VNQDKSQVVFEDNTEQPAGKEDLDDVYDNFDDYPSDLPLDFQEHPNIAEEMQDEEAYHDLLRIVDDATR